jgi:hypothetical protein
VISLAVCRVLRFGKKEMSLILSHWAEPAEVRFSEFTLGQGS